MLAVSRKSDSSVVWCRVVQQRHARLGWHGGSCSIASPQDLQSAINGNPATLTQYRGTQFGFGSAWIEPTYNLTVDAPGLPLIGVSPFFDAKSDAQGVAAGNIGVTQDYSAWGLPVTTGIGLMAGSGAGVDFRHIPQSNGTHASIIALDIVVAAGVDLTERLSTGASLTLSNSTLDGPFVGISSSSTDFALRGRIGVNYRLFPATSVGGFWATKAGYTFENLAGFTPGNFFDVKVDRPQMFGVGISNRSLLDGRSAARAGCAEPAIHQHGPLRRNLRRSMGHPVGCPAGSVRSHSIADGIRLERQSDA